MCTYKEIYQSPDYWSLRFFNMTMPRSSHPALKMTFNVGRFLNTLRLMSVDIDNLFNGQILNFYFRKREFLIIIMHLHSHYWDLVVFFLLTLVYFKWRWSMLKMKRQFSGKNQNYLDMQKAGAFFNLSFPLAKYVIKCTQYVNYRKLKDFA